MGRRRAGAAAVSVAEFVFAPGDYVTVILFDLKYRGRVDACVQQVDGLLYDVRYADDSGELKFGKFSADELERAKARL